MSNSIMTTIYNQYSTTYMPRKSDTRHDSHKRSELRNICSTMAKLNRDTPLYLLKNNSDTRQYIIGLKEESRALRNTIMESFGSADNAGFNRKIAYSSNENIISAKYIGDSTSSSYASVSDEFASDASDDAIVSANGEIPTYDIEVISLASPQVNLGKYLPMQELGIQPGEYSFDVTVNDQGYEFQFSIGDSDTNHNIQQRLSRLINNSKIGLNASVEEDGDGNSALRIESAKVGIDSEQHSQIFNISDDATSMHSGAVSFLGIDHIVKDASNAQFKVNGTEVSASSNTFILQKDYELTLNGISENEGQTVTIGVKPDTVALQENISNLIGGYNNFIRSVNEFQELKQRSQTLTKEMGRITSYYQREMEKLGISPNVDGTLSLDGDQLNRTVALEDSAEALSSLKDFSQSMLRKSSQISINPIEYINKKIVAYKNPSNNFLSPYVTSAYAGMLFNNYC